VEKSGRRKDTLLIIGLPPEQAEGFSRALMDIEAKTAEWTKHFRLAEKLAAQEKYEQAIEEYKKAIDSSGGGWRESSAREGLADIYETTGQYLLAAEEVQRVLNNTAEWGKAPLSERLVSLQAAARGDFAAAVEHAKRALDLYAKSPPPHDDEETYKRHLHLLEEKAKAQRGP